MSQAELLAALCRKHLSVFTQKAFNILEPATDYNHNWHVDCIAEHLQAVWDKEIQYLIINMPPRELKTHTTSISFPAWAMGQNPSIRFMLTSFKSSLAESMTRKTRLLMKSEYYKFMFPRTQISDELDRQYYFETTERGQYYSGAMSSVTGVGCDIQIVDDPINPDEALSDTIRNNTNETIRGTLFSRFNDPKSGRFILNMQRLHEDDPTGNLLKEQGWYHLKLPAENRTSVSFKYTMRGYTWELKPGELLNPARLDREVLDRKLELLGEYNYSGQFLQEPVPLGGGELQEAWLQYYQYGTINAKRMNTFILVDPANEKKKTSDWSVFAVIGLNDDNNYYLLDMVRARLNPTERVDMLFVLHRKWNGLTGKPPKVGYEKYGMMTDTHYIDEKKKKDAYHFSLVELGGQQKKEDRIRRIIPDMQMGRWYVPYNLPYVDEEGRLFDLISEMKSEMKSFPRARFDDIMDCITRIYEPELFAVFPLPKQTLTAAAQEGNNDEGYSDFMDF